MTKCKAIFTSLTKRLDERKSIDDIVCELCPDVKHGRKKVIRWITDFYGTEYLKDNAEFLEYQPHKVVKKFTTFDDKFNNTKMQDFDNVVKTALSNQPLIIRKYGISEQVTDNITTGCKTDLNLNSDIILRNPTGFKKLLKNMPRDATMNLNKDRLNFTSGDYNASVIVDLCVNDFEFYKNEYTMFIHHLRQHLTQDDVAHIIKNTDIDDIFYRINNADFYRAVEEWCDDSNDIKNFMLF